MTDKKKMTIAMLPKELRTNDQALMLSEIWSNFSVEYLPFVKFTNGVALVVFTADDPIEYVNKWGRIQWKIACIQDAHQCFLSAGKRFFSALLHHCNEKHLRPSELMDVTITRAGSGFSTEYKLS